MLSMFCFSIKVAKAQTSNNGKIPVPADLINSSDNTVIPVCLLFVENYGSLKSDSTDGSEADRIIIINKPQTQQFCNNKIRWDMAS